MKDLLDLDKFEKKVVEYTFFLKEQGINVLCEYVQQHNYYKISYCGVIQIITLDNIDFILADKKDAFKSLYQQYIDMLNETRDDNIFDNGGYRK